ncbi:MAG TPA: hypothetical protein VMW18_17625 [Candidatus Binatia bacterium]|nr:hypothetical protein [Candidatus Binatia bacterium]
MEPHLRFVIGLSLRCLDFGHVFQGCSNAVQLFKAPALSPLDSLIFPTGTPVALTVALQKENGGAA